jgi:TPP-dependent pyruvate/acetoin dehydrogenase alpha subunit
MPEIRPSDKQLLEMFRTMLLIRKLQLKIEDLYAQDEMKTPVHLCIGQEAIAAGTCMQLAKEDKVLSNHRGHGHYLAKGGDLNKLVAELYGRETGCAHGRGGSMHLVDIAAGIIGNSAIVGGGIPIAVGMAFGFKMKKEPNIVVSFFGDGGADEGALYESVNYAVLKGLPVIFACENNQYSVCSRVSDRQKDTNIAKKFKNFGLPSRRVNGNDIFAVYAAVHEAISKARKGRGPSFIEFSTYRIRGHAGSGSDACLGYRTQAEIDSWSKKCPVEKLENYLIKKNKMDKTTLEKLNTALDRKISEAFSFAQNSPLPKKEELGKYLYALD